MDTVDEKHQADDSEKQFYWKPAKRQREESHTTEGKALILHCGNK